MRRELAVPADIQERADIAVYQVGLAIQAYQVQVEFQGTQVNRDILAYPVIVAGLDKSVLRESLVNRGIVVNPGSLENLDIRVLVVNRVSVDTVDGRVYLA